MLIPGPAQVNLVSPSWGFPGGGSWVSPLYQANGTITPVTATLYVYPFVAPRAFEISAMACQIANTPSGDSIIRLGAWSPTVTGFAPGALICDTGGLAVPTGGTKTLPVSGSFQAGINFLGLVYPVSTTPGTVEFSNPQAGMFAYYLAGTNPSLAQGNDGSVFTQAGVTGALPNPFVGTWVGNSNSPNRCPTIALRVV